MKTSTPIDPSATLADLAVRHAAASRVFHRHGLDFCCHGQVSLAEACRRAGLDSDRVLAELGEALAASPGPEEASGAPLSVLIEHILERFHRPHREEVPRLLAMARRVEEVHAEKASCPRGLADHLEHMAVELEQHMRKEEEVLFPIILAGRGRMAAMPISVMELEHRDHGRNLERLRALAHDFVPPAEACNTWRALYLGLAELERELMQHIHLENNVLFPRTLKG